METVIKNSKIKPVAILFISLTLAICCVFLVIGSQKGCIVGYIGFTFFSFGCIYLIYRLIKGGGIVLNDEGIVTDRNNPDDSFIPWKDIERFSLREENGIRTIDIHLYNPQSFIDKQRNKSIRRNMEINQSLHNATVGISSNLLAISYKNLEEILVNKLETSRISKN